MEIGRIGRLPSERAALTTKFVIQPFGDKGRIKGYFTAGFDPESGEVREVFIRLDKVGSAMHGMLEALGVVVSLALQSGVPAEKVAEKLRGRKFEPAGWVVAGEGMLERVRDAQGGTAGGGASGGANVSQSGAQVSSVVDLLGIWLGSLAKGYYR